MSRGCNIQEFSVGDTSVGDGLTLHPPASPPVLRLHPSVEACSPLLGPAACALLTCAKMQQIRLEPIIMPYLYLILLVCITQLSESSPYSTQIGEIYNAGWARNWLFSAWPFRSQVPPLARALFPVVSLLATLTTLTILFSLSAIIACAAELRKLVRSKQSCE